MKGISNAHTFIALVVLQLAACALAEVNPELAVTSPLELLQRTCSKQYGKVPTLNQTDCVKCMTRVAESTGTQSLLGCHSICQSRNNFKHFKSSDTGPAKACSSCMSAPGVPASHCAMCLNFFSRDSTGAQTCMTCLQGNKHGWPLQSYADGCTHCASMPNATDARNCNACISMGKVDPRLCDLHAAVRAPKLTINFTSASPLDTNGLLAALEAMVNKSGTRVESSGTPTHLMVQYKYDTQLMLDASGLAMKHSLQGALDPFFSAVASACRNCTIHLSGLFTVPSQGSKGLVFGCSYVNMTADWESIVVTRLCNHSSGNSTGRHLLQNSLYSTVDTTWQYPSFVTSAAQSSSCSPTTTGCGASSNGEQNLVQQVCMWGGWYVNALQVTWEDGSVQNWGNQDNNPVSCLNLAIDEGEVITGVYSQVGDWMNGLAFVTNFGQVAQMGCSDDGGGNGCPGNSEYTQWKYPAVAATPSAISQAQFDISNGWTTSNALSAALAQTTSSGYLCGINVCSGDYINQITLYFMLPVSEMVADSTLNMVVGAPGSTATSVDSYNYADNLCSQPGDVAGAVMVSTNTQVSSSLAVGTSYSTQYSKTSTEGWGLTAGYSVAPVGPSVTASYSGSVATTSSSTSTAGTQTTTSTSSGTTGSVTENQICPSGIAPNTYCNWTFYGYSTIAWTPTTWSIPATYSLLGGASWSTTLGGSTTSGTESFTGVQLTSLICDGVQYVTQSPPPPAGPSRK